AQHMGAPSIRVGRSDARRSKGLLNRRSSGRPRSIAQGGAAEHPSVGRLDRDANLGSASSLAPFLNLTIGFGCAHNVRSMTAKPSNKRVASVRGYVASKPKAS